MYHPQLGQFLQRDPIRYRGGDFNLYNYVRNSPVNRTDPLGLYERTPGIEDCSELLGMGIQQKIEGILNDEAHERKNRRNKLYQWRQKCNDRFLEQAREYEQLRQQACDKLKAILDCVPQVVGPLAPGVDDVLDKAREIVRLLCDQPYIFPGDPETAPVPVPNPVPDPVIPFLFIPWLFGWHPCPCPSPRRGGGGGGGNFPYGGGPHFPWEPVW